MARNSTGGHSPSYYAWKRLKQNKPAFLGLCFIILCTLIALAGYLVLPDPTPNANAQILELETIPPGSEVTILKIRKNISPEHISLWQRLTAGKPSLYTDIPVSAYRFEAADLIYTPYGASAADEERISLADVLFPLPAKPRIEMKKDRLYWMGMDGKRQSALINDLIASVKHSRIEQRTYWLGTDRFGRDMLSRLLLGTRISLSVGFISVTISLFIGILLGSMAGFFRGWVDHFIIWLINIVWSIPTFLLVMAFALVLGRGFWQVFVAVGLTMWVEAARLVRGQILMVREMEYVQASRALGFKSPRIISRHIIPNILGPVMVIAAANFATAILLEAGLSFLGLGVQPPTPSWGVMINEHYGYIVVDAAYLAILPGLAIMLLVLSFNLLGNGLRDALDVRLK